MATNPPVTYKEFQELIYAQIEELILKKWIERLSLVINDAHNLFDVCSIFPAPVQVAALLRKRGFNAHWKHGHLALAFDPEKTKEQVEAQLDLIGLKEKPPALHFELHSLQPNGAMLTGRAQTKEEFDAAKLRAAAESRDERAEVKEARDYVAKVIAAEAD